MKVRGGFVSNSSSCSFVIGKAYMTEEQIKKFQEFIHLFDELVGYNFDDEKLSEVLDKADLRHITKDEVMNSVKADDFFEGITPFDTTYYFVGELDDHIVPPLVRFLKTIGVDEKYIESVS